MTWSEQKEWEMIEDDIAELEGKISQIEADMVENGADFGKLSELQAQLDETNQALEDKMMRWEELSERVEG